MLQLSWEARGKNHRQTRETAETGYIFLLILKVETILFYRMFDSIKPIRKVNRDILANILTEVASEASKLYSDFPRDHKRQQVTPQGVMGAGSDPRNIDVIEAVVNNSNGKRVLDVDMAYGIYWVVLQRRFGFKFEELASPRKYCSVLPFSSLRGY